MDKEYIESLERVIKQMLTPIKDLPFKLIIGAMTGREVIDFDKTNKQHNVLLNNITTAIQNACVEVNKTGIQRPRPNEVGNDIEPFLKRALCEIEGLNARTPRTASGTSKSTGYPDIEVEYGGDKICYIECKTYNIQNINTTQRSFYLSPSDNFKVNKDGIHFIVSFEIYVAGRADANNIYKAKSWKIFDASKLECDVKYEFNSDNRRMYDKKLLLAEGSLT